MVGFPSCRASASSSEAALQSSAPDQPTLNACNQLYTSVVSAASLCCAAQVSTMSMHAGLSSIRRLERARCVPGQVSDQAVVAFWMPTACFLVLAVHVLHCALIEPSSIRMDAAIYFAGMGLPDIIRYSALEWAHCMSM